MEQLELNFDATQDAQESINRVMREGTFYASYDGRTYMGVRFNKDRVYTLARLLTGKVLRTESKDFMISFDAIPLNGEPLGRITISEQDWYVTDMDGRIYIISDHGVEQFEGLRPLSFDWYMYDLFPRTLEMYKHYSDSRYEVERE